MTPGPGPDDGGRGRSRRARPARAWWLQLATRSTLFGMPVPLIVVALVLATGVGVLLSLSLQVSTTTTLHSSNVGTDQRSSPELGDSGLPVITEDSLGPEVQSLIESGSARSAATFDVDLCLQEQGITEQVLTLEQVQWGDDGPPAWVLVHGPLDRKTLQDNGGVVNVTVVTTNCGTDDGGNGPGDRLWTGATMLGIDSR